MKNHPQKLFIISPQFSLWTGLASQTAQKQKSHTTYSPLMQDWVFRLGWGGNHHFFSSNTNVTSSTMIQIWKWWGQNFMNYFVKYTFSKKATKLVEIFTVDLTSWIKYQINVEDFSIFVAFSEYVAYIVESFGHNNNVRRLFFSLAFDPSLFKKFIAVDREHDFLVQIGHLFSNF